MATLTPATDPVVTKQMFQAAQKGLGMCLRCRDKISTFRQLGYDFPEIESQIDQWQPRLEAVVQHYHENGGVPGDR